MRNKPPTGYCFVCWRKIGSQGAVHIGKDLDRHWGCKPGSIKWKRSPASLDSKMTDYYKEKKGK